MLIYPHSHYIVKLKMRKDVCSTFAANSQTILFCSRYLQSPPTLVTKTESSRQKVRLIIKTK